MIEVSFAENDVRKLSDMVLNHPHHFVRHKALVLLLKANEISHKAIAKNTGVCENTVSSYCKAYALGGIEELTKINFRKPISSLAPFEQVIRDYIDKTPPASIKQACKEIEDLTGIKLKETQMRKYLKSLGAKFRKVGGIPAKADILQQQEFLKTELEPRLEEAKKGKRTLYFVDAAHFVLGAFLGHLWSTRRIFIKTPSGRQRLNVLGALDAITKELLTITNDTYITSTQICELLELIKSKATNPVTIVLDNAKYQRCKLVTDTAKVLGIELLFLPPYSPNLNLIERLWKFTRKGCLNSRYYPEFKPFREAIGNFLEDVHIRHADELKTLLTPKIQLFEEAQLRSI